MGIPTTESCQDVTDSSLSAGAALAMIEEKLQPVTGTEALPLQAALDRVLAQPVISPIDVPAHRNSAMDGYALAGADLPTEGIASFQVIGTAFAGRPFNESVPSGACVRIMTGARMPADTDTVVIQEQVEPADDSIRLDASHRAGANVREAGEDVAAGSSVLEQGTRIGPAQLGLLASLGITELRMHRRVRVAFFSSGDEICSLGEPLGEGQIYDSNRYTLYGMLTRLGTEVIDMGVVPDREDAIGTALIEGAAMADLVLTSGGVSVGEADYVVAAIERLGTRYFSKVAIKPGRPLTFGRIADSCFFGLPGNPVAVMITFLQFVRPALRRLMGEAEDFIPSFKVPCRSRLRKSPGRTEYQRGILALGEGNELEVRSTGRQGSGVLSSMSAGNCFIVLPEDAGDVAPGDRVEVQPFALL